MHCNEFSSADRSRSDTVRMKEGYWPVRLEPGSEARVDPWEETKRNWQDFQRDFFFVLHVGQRLYPASLFYCPRVHDFNETSTYLTAQPSGGRRLFCKRTSADSADDFFFLNSLTINHVPVRRRLVTSSFSHSHSLYIHCQGLTLIPSIVVHVRVGPIRAKQKVI